MSFLDYTFFQYALVGLVIISIAGSMIGTYITTRRMVSITGGITHACFGGLGLGYFLGISPVITAAVFAVASALGIESLSTRYRVREDSAIAVVWSLGMAVGILFVFLTPGYVPELNSFLFGNVLTISSIDLMAFAIYTAVTALFLACFRKVVVACAFDCCTVGQFHYDSRGRCRHCVDHTSYRHNAADFNPDSACNRSRDMVSPLYLYYGYGRRCRGG